MVSSEWWQRPLSVARRGQVSARVADGEVLFVGDRSRMVAIELANGDAT